MNNQYHQVTIHFVKKAVVSQVLRLEFVVIIFRNFLCENYINNKVPSFYTFVLKVGRNYGMVFKLKVTGSFLCIFVIW